MPQTQNKQPSQIDQLLVDYTSRRLDEEADRQGVPRDFARRALGAESGGRADVIRGRKLSRAGAIGPLQLMPDTADELGVDPYNIDENVEGSVRYLKRQLDSFGGDRAKAAAAYNWGAGNVRKRGLGQAPAETRAYVKKVAGAAQGGSEIDNLYGEFYGRPSRKADPDEERRSIDIGALPKYDERGRRKIGARDVGITPVEWQEGKVYDLTTGKFIEPSRQSQSTSPRSLRPGARADLEIPTRSAKPRAVTRDQLLADIAAQMGEREMKESAIAEAQARLNKLSNADLSKEHARLTKIFATVPETRQARLEEERRRDEYYAQPLHKRIGREMDVAAASVGESINRAASRVAQPVMRAVGLDEATDAWNRAAAEKSAILADELEEQERIANRLPSKITRGLTAGGAQALIMAPVAMTTGPAGVTALTALESDVERDPGGALASTIAAPVSMAAGRLVSPRAARFAAGFASKPAQKAAQVGIEGIAGAGANVGQYAATSAALGRPITAEDLTEQAVTGGVISGVTAPGALRSLRPSARAQVGAPEPTSRAGMEFEPSPNIRAMGPAADEAAIRARMGLTDSAESSTSRAARRSPNATTSEIDQLYDQFAGGQGKAPGRQAGEPETPTVIHPNPEIDRKPVLAKTGDGRVIVENRANKTGVSVVKDRSGEPTEHKFSSTQVDLPKDLADEITAFGRRIPDRDLAEKGRETEPHITLKYGLHGWDPKVAQEALAGEGPIKVRFGKVSLFQNDDADVVKVDIDSPDLHRLNQKIADAHPNTETQPTYEPHATIAYVRPGQGRKYAGSNFLEGQTITLDRITFSGRDDRQVEIHLSGAKKASTPAEAAQVSGEPVSPRWLNAQRRRAAELLDIDPAQIPMVDEAPEASLQNLQTRPGANLARAVGSSPDDYRKVKVADLGLDYTEFPPNPPAGAKATRRQIPIDDITLGRDDLNKGRMNQVQTALAGGLKAGGETYTTPGGGRRKVQDVTLVPDPARPGKWVVSGDGNHRIAYLKLSGYRGDVPVQTWEAPAQSKRSSGAYFGSIGGALQPLFEGANTKPPKGPQPEAPGRRQRFFETVGAAQTLGQLGSPGFVMRNIIGHASHGAQEVITKGVGGILDKAVAVITGKRTVGGFGNPMEFAREVGRFTADYKAGVRQAREAIGRGEPLPGSRLADMPDPQTLTAFGRKIQKILQYINEVPDAGAWNSHFQASLRDQARALSLSRRKPSASKSIEQVDEVIALAWAEADHASMRDKNFVSDSLRRLKKFLNTTTRPLTGTDKFGLGDFVVKYVQVPGSLVKKGIEYSPAGILEAGYYATKGDQRRAVQSLSRAITGSTTGVGVGAALAALGILVGPERDKGQLSQLEREGGMRGYSVNISALKRLAGGGWDDPESRKLRKGDTLIGIDWVQPWAMQSSAGAAVYDLYSKGKLGAGSGSMAVGRAVYDSLAKALDVMGDQSALKNFGRYVASAHGGDWKEWTADFLGNVGLDVPSSFVPSVARQARQVLDPYERDTRPEDPEDFVVEAKNRALAQLPGVSERFPTKPSVLTGEPRKTAIGDYSMPIRGLRQLSPAPFTTYQPSDVAQEMGRLTDAGFKVAFSPPKREKGERTSVLRLREARFADGFASQAPKLLNHPFYRLANDEAKAEALNDLAKQLRAATRKTIDAKTVDEIIDRAGDRVENRRGRAR